MITNQCISCGKDFEVDETKRNWQSKKLCSKECQRSHSNKMARLKYAPIQWPQKKNCLHCGVEFLIHEDGNIARKYCGDECQKSVKAKRQSDKVEARQIAKKCSSCGKEFIPSKYARFKQVYCSNDCRKTDRHKQQYLKGADKSKIRNAYKYDFKRIRPQVLERDNHKCILCGSSDKLHVHHMDNSGGLEQVNNDLWNLVAMCDVCHYAIHNITLIQVNGEWKLDGKIFEIIGLTGSVKIK